MSAQKSGLHASAKAGQDISANPRLYQAMELFDMSHAALSEHLQQEVYANPCLELTADESDESSKDEEELDERDDEDPEAEFDWEEIILGSDRSSEHRGAFEPKEYPEPSAVEVPSLHDYLEGQLALTELAPRQARAAREIVGNIDDDGFLSCSSEAVAEGLNQQMARLRAEAADTPSENAREDDADLEAAALLAPYLPEEIDAVLPVVQGLDPPGVGARDLRGCLEIQLRRDGREESLAYRIIGAHFDDLVNHRWTDISRAMGLSPKEIQEAKDQIAELDPRPGRQLSGEPDHYIIPDLIVELVGGEYLVFVNEGGMPKLRVSPYYRDIVARGKFTDENKKFITTRMNAAAWLVQAIEQRRRTMLRVMRFIVEQQHEFFEKGARYLKPLTLRTVALHVEMAESTISRVTSKKYVQTPRGVFPLRYFFSRGVGSGEGEVSTRVVKDRIRSLVEAENPKKPLTDQAIMDLLKQDGFEVARRTVGKYRVQLNIPVARARKRY